MELDALQDDLSHFKEVIQEQISTFSAIKKNEK
jgi:hypothetical protein